MSRRINMNRVSPEVYEAMLAARPGMFARDELWWNRVLATAHGGQVDGDPLHCLLAEDDSGPRGYALYSADGRWDRDTSLPDGVLSVRDVLAHSSDVGTIKIALNLGAPRFYDTMRDFGIGQLTGIELPGENRGLLRPLENWTPSSIGSPTSPISHTPPGRRR